MRYHRYIPKVLALSTGVLFLAGCRNEVSAAESAGKHTESVSIAAAAAASSFDEPAFSLSLSKSGSYSAGNSGALMLELKAKAPHHVNQEYPHKLKLKPVDGILFPNPTLARDAMTLEPMAIVLRVPLKPTRAGAFKVEGEFAFSLCTADRCLIEKRTLVREIEVQ